MSKENKFNPGLYTQAGRLTPDEHARERKKQGAGPQAAEGDTPKRPRKRRRTLPKG